MAVDVSMRKHCFDRYDKHYLEVLMGTDKWIGCTYYMVSREMCIRPNISKLKKRQWTSHVLKFLTGLKGL